MTDFYTTGIEIEASSHPTLPQVSSFTRSVLQREFALVHPEAPWTSKEDASAGHEFVSPVLKSFEQLKKEVTEVTGLLNNRNLHSIRKSGLHVHLGYQNKNLAFKYRVARFVSRYQIALLGQILCPWTERSGFCMPLSQGNIDMFKSGKGLDLFFSANSPSFNFSYRYYWVNLHAINAHGTIEFRAHNGTLDAEQIINWVCFLQCIFRALDAGGWKPDWEPNGTVEELVVNLRRNHHPNAEIQQRALKFLGY